MLYESNHHPSVDDFPAPPGGRVSRSHPYLLESLPDDADSVPESFRAGPAIPLRTALYLSRL